MDIRNVRLEKLNGETTTVAKEAKKLGETYKEGLKNISAGTVEYTDGDGVRSSDTQLSVKSEAQPIAFGVGG